MAHLKTLQASFEKQLKNKLTQKTKFGVGEEGFLLRSFKFFDVANKGALPFEGFKKSIEKIGVVIDAEDMKLLFDLYDLDKDGSINYTEFSAILFDHAGGEQDSASAKVEAKKEASVPIIEQLRKKIVSRGARGIIGLAKLFKIMDDNKSGSLDLEEFTKAVKEYKIGLEDHDIGTLFKVFDPDKSGMIDYNEFLRTVRGEMNEFRKALVDKAFDRLDLNRNGIIESSDIKGLYNPSRHPAVLEGRKTEDQILQEFLETFEAHHNLRAGQEKDYQITREEFREYYNNISASIDSDEYFEVMINNAWNLSGKADSYGKYQKGWSSEAGKPEPRVNNMESRDSPLKHSKYSKEETKHGRKGEEIDPLNKFVEERKLIPSEKEKEKDKVEEKKSPPRDSKNKFGNIVATDLPKYQNIMLERFRAKLVSRGGKGVIGLERQFKIFDLDGSGYLDKDEFKKAINDYKLEMDERDLDSLFKIFDKNNDLKIDYSEFMETIIGKMSEFRLNLVMKAFESLDESGDGVISLEEIKKVYSAKLHPEVKSGRKTEDEVISEFMNTFEIHLSSTSEEDKPNDGRITKAEFISYYNHISAAIESDPYFDLLISNAWKLGFHSDSNRQPYAGINSKVYNVDSKSCWNYDHHKTLFEHEHPMMQGEEEGAGSKYEKVLSIYERSEVAKAGVGGSAKKAPKKTEEVVDRKEMPDIEILKFVRDKLHARGARGVIGVKRKFAIIDDDNSGSIDKVEFAKAMKELRIGLVEKDIERLFAMFDINHDGTISYPEFMKIIVGEMNQTRKQIVEMAFKKLDKTKDGVITVDDLKDVYRANRHPDVIAKRKTEGEILSEFLDTFEQNYSIIHPEAKDRIITLEEFLEYYNNVSASIDDDKFFELMLVNAWNLNEVGPYQKAWATDY